MLSRMLCAISFLDGKDILGSEFLFCTSVSKSTLTSSHLVLCLTIVDRQTVSLSHVAVLLVALKCGVARVDVMVDGPWSNGLKRIDGLTGRQCTVTSE
jgi:hypothetical protein